MIKRLLVLLLIIAYTAFPAFSYEEASLVTVIVETEENFDFSLFEGLGEIKYIYSETFFGFSAEVYERDIEKIKELPKVLKVSADTYYNMPYTEPSEELFSFFSEENGYDGEGAVIAIIDGGFRLAHPIYSITEGKETGISKDDVAKLLYDNDFNAENTTVSSDTLYKSAKVPFAYDYADKDTDVYNSKVAHGNAVAGIASGNSASYKGILPEAQLVLMKVAKNSGTIYNSDILAAFEDAVRVGVDGINLSLGSMSGFSTDSADQFDMETPFENARKKGIIIAVAAGNSGVLSSEGLDKVKYKGGFPEVTNTDYGLISRPASAPSCTAVAAADVSSGTVAYFSSAGVTPDLCLKPDISAKGTNYRVADLTSYSSGSGTSYASPEICAKAVAVKKELETRGIPTEKISYLTEQLIMSSADIMYDSNDIAVSPRLQGSGYIDTEGAISAKAVLYGADGKTKISLKDNLSDTFSIVFKAENLTTGYLTYNPSLTLITDGYKNGKITGKSIEIPHTVTFTPGTVRIGANQTASVRALVKIDSEWAKSHSEIFKNGFFLDGFVNLESSEEILNIPFTGYYGSWYSAPVFIPDSKNKGFGFAEYLTSDKTPSGLFYLGNNIMESKLKDKVTDSSKVAFSPNSDGVLDILKIYPALYRNVWLLYWEVRAADGTAVIENGTYYFPKGYGPEYFGNSFFNWNGKDENGNIMPDGQYSVYAAAVLDYGNKKTIAEEITRPVFLDTTPPRIKSMSIYSEEGKRYLKTDISDNHQLMVTAVTDAEGNEVSKDLITTSGEVILDITDVTERFLFETADYAFNITTENITLADKYTVFYKGKNISRITAEEEAWYEGYTSEKPSFEADETHAKVFIWKKNMEPLYTNNFNK